MLEQRKEECKICATCKHNKYEKDWDSFGCDNEESENYGIPTDYDYGCEDWEKK